MKIIKISPLLVTLCVILYFALTPQYMGCKKETIKTISDTTYLHDTTYYDVACPLKGTYNGTSTASTGSSSALTYTFQDHNFAVGKLPNGTGITFGGYRNNCDSVILSVYYTVNSTYYILRGKFSNNRNTISGTFNNLTTTTDFGTFTMSK